MNLLNSLMLLLGRENYTKIFLLLFFMIVSMFLEMLSIGALIPLLMIILDKNFLQNYPLVLDFFSSLELNSHFEFIMLFAIIIIILYVIKFLFLVFYAFYQSNFVWNLQARTSKRLYKIYIYQPYLFHLNTNSSIILRNTVGEVGQFSSAVMATTNLIGEVLVIVGILGIMFFFEPMGTMIVFSIVLIGAFIFYFYIKDRVKIFGEKRQYHEGLKIKSLQEGLGAIKHVKLSSLEENIINNFYNHSQSSANASKFNSFLQSFPRLWLEFISVISVLIVLLYFANINQNFDKILVLLGIFAAGAVRIIPAANRILYNLQAIRFALPVIKNLSEQISLPIKNKLHSPKPLELQNALEILNVSYKYPSADKNIISSLNLTIKKNSVVGIIGKSGSGKSTILNLILGFLKPSEGEILIDGINLEECIDEWQGSIGYVSQNIYLIDGSLRENIAFGVAEDQIDEQRLSKAIEDSGLKDFINNLKTSITTVVGERGGLISGGQKQRVAIARALYNRPNILILDELSSALDEETEDKIVKSISQMKNVTKILVTHRSSLLKYCDDVVRLSE